MGNERLGSASPLFFFFSFWVFLAGREREREEAERERGNLSDGLFFPAEILFFSKNHTMMIGKLGRFSLFWFFLSHTEYSKGIPMRWRVSLWSYGIPHDGWIPLILIVLCCSL